MRATSTCWPATARTDAPSGGAVRERAQPLAWLRGVFRRRAAHRRGLIARLLDERVYIAPF